MENIDTTALRCDHSTSSGTAAALWKDIRFTSERHLRCILSEGKQYNKYTLRSINKLEVKKKQPEFQKGRTKNAERFPSCWKK